jgi:hypothetical protein
VGQRGSACWKWDEDGSSTLPHTRCCVKRESIIDVAMPARAGPASTFRYLNIFTPTAVYHMFSRLNQVARHLARPLPNYLHNSAFAGSAAMAQERSKRTINTAACLIIGDEVLGGKVSISEFNKDFDYVQGWILTSILDSRHQLRLVRKVLLLPRHQPQAHRSHLRR